MNNNKFIGIYFKIGNKLYTTKINRDSLKKFKTLINNYSVDFKIVDPVEHKKYHFLPIETILLDAYNNLNNPVAQNLLISLIAQNVKNTNILINKIK